MDTYTTRLGDIGRDLGVSALQVGKMLRAAGLRTSSGYPTAKALDSGAARSVWDGQSRTNEWCVEKVVALLKKEVS
jgi:hypothetical protein